MAIAASVLACCSVVPRGLAAEPAPASKPDDAYFTRIIASAIYSRLGAELHCSEDLHPLLPEAEAIFNSHKRELLEPFVPYLRTFDGKEYPQLELSVYGSPARQEERKGLFDFFINVFATLKPWGQGKAPGGVRPLVDETPMGGVEWDPKTSRVKRFSLGGPYRALPPNILDEALQIAHRYDKQYTRQALDTIHTGWEPSWLHAFSQPVEPQKAPPPGDAKQHLVVLEFEFPGQGPIHAVPAHRVRVSLRTGTVLSVQASTIDGRPIHEPARPPG